MAQAFRQGVAPLKEMGVCGAIEIRSQPIAALDFGTDM
jgi:hypothetical protein